MLNAILYVAELVAGPAETVGNWHTIYTRMNRWSKNGVLASSNISSAARALD